MLLFITIPILRCDDVQIVTNIIYQMNRQRPYRPQGSRSPVRESFQVQQHYRVKEMLRTDLSMLEEENALLKLKCKKVVELEEKVEMVLKQNVQLLSQNQKLSRVLHQQKSETDILRNKCEALSNQKATLLGDFEMERKKMLRQLEMLEDRVAEEQAMKSGQASELRGQYQLEFQNLKRQFQNSQTAYQAEIRKLREQIDKRDHEIADYANRIKRISTQSDYELLKAKEQREKYRSELAYCQADRVKQLQQLKHKLQNNYLEEIQSIKRSHLGSLEDIELQNGRLKDELDDKTRENQAMASKFSKQRAYYQDTITYLKRDLENYRDKIVQTEEIGSLELNQLREKLHIIHESEMDQLEKKMIMQIRALQDEIGRLQSINHGKNIEIEQLIKDKVTTRGIFDSQVIRLKDQLGALSQKYKDLELRHSDLNSQATNRLNDREKHIQYLQDVVKTQRNNHQSQSTSLQKIIDTLKQQLSNEKLIYRENEQRMKEEVAEANHQLNEVKTQAEIQKATYEKIIYDLKNELNGTSDNLNSKADALNSKNRMVENQNQKLKSSIVIKDKEIKNLVQRLKSSSQRQSKLEGQIDELRSKMIKRQQKSNDTLNEQKNRLDSSFNYAIENLRADHEVALKLQANRYRDLQEKLRKKQAQLQEILKMYKKMTDQIQILTQQQANKKDITLKFPGATADLIASKNLFDVYLKTKVLDICGDALKENRH